MPTLTIVSWTVLNFHRPGTSARLKIWFGQDFVTAENQHVLGGAVRSGSIYLDVALSLDADTHILTIPTFSLPTTDDSSVRNVRATGVLFDASGAFVRNLFTNFIIPSELADITTFAALNAWNAAPTLPPQSSAITREQALVLIQEGLSAEPLNGTLSLNTVPRASSPKTLVDGMAVDDGTNWTMQTLGSIQFGDVEEAQHGTRLAVSDEEGRASFFAGGGPVATPSNEYAGVAAVCTETDAEVFVQSTGYSNLYGHKSITRVGDTASEHNGTFLEVDDVNSRIKLTNLPTSNPGIAGVLWRSGNDVKISTG